MHTHDPSYSNPNLLTLPLATVKEILFFYSGNWTFITSLDKIKFSCVTIETSRSDEGTFSRRRLVENFVVKAFKRECRRAPLHDIILLSFTSITRLWHQYLILYLQHLAKKVDISSIGWLSIALGCVHSPRKKKKTPVLLNLNSDVLHRQLKDQ